MQTLKTLAYLLGLGIAGLLLLMSFPSLAAIEVGISDWPG